MSFFKTGLSFLFSLGLVAAADRPLYFEQRGSQSFRARAGERLLELGPDRVQLDDVTLRFVGASAGARLEGFGPTAPSTYFSRAGTVRLQQFPKVRNEGIYPGVDAVFYGNAREFEYDLVLAADGDINAIRLRVEGGHPALDGDGNLVVGTSAGEIRQMAPRVFEERGAMRREIRAKYVLHGEEIAFEVERRDPGAQVTIDPVVVYRKYFGGSGLDTGGPIATDASGNVYVTGSSNSTDFPTTNGTSARVTPPLLAFSNGGQSVTKLPVGTQVSVTAIGGTPDGSVIYLATPNGIFISGNHGASFTQTAPLGKTVQVQGISVDQIDPSRVFVATNGGLFVGSTAGQAWGEIDAGLPVSGNGVVNVTSTLISPADHAVSFAIAGFPSALYRTLNAGGTWQRLAPAYPGEPAVPQFSSTNITVAMTADGKTLYAIDGNGVMLESADNGSTWKQLAGQLYGARSITIDPNGAAIYVVDNFGLQRSTDGGASFSMISPLLQGGDFVVAFAKDGGGALYLATSSVEFNVSRDNGVTWIPLPRRPNIHALAGLGGQVYSAEDSASVPFVTKWSSDGSKVLYSAFFGGSFSDAIRAIRVNGQGEAVIAGTAASADFPVTQTIPPVAAPPFANGFVAKLSADGSQVAYSTIFGGSQIVSVNGLAIDSTGAPYLTGSTTSTDFPTTTNALQTALPGGLCARPNPGPLSPTTNLGQFAWAAKFKPDGSGLAYSTFLAAACGSVAQGIAVNTAGEAVIAGYTTSPDFPVSASAYQGTFTTASASSSLPGPSDFGFVSRLSAGGDKLVASTLVGGGFHTEANAVTLDASGNTYVTGSTWGITPGATAGAYQKTVGYACAIFSFGVPLPPSGGADVFVLKLDPGLSTAGFLTYLGGNCDDTGMNVALAPNGNVWVSGFPSSTFPLVTPFAFYGTGSGFVSELSADASQLLYSSIADGSNIAVDPAGAVYVSGSGQGLSGPVKNQPSNSVSLTKIDPSAARTVVITSVGAATSYQKTPQSTSPSMGVVAPGELIAITGQHLGPATTLNGQVDATGRLPFTLGATTVSFNAYVAPLLSVQDGLIICMAPFEVSGVTEVTVKADGQSSEAVRLQASVASPYILSVTNQDGTPNGPDHPATQGSEVVIYMSGLGLTTPLSQDGDVSAAPLPVPAIAPVVFLAGTQTPVAFAAAAYGYAAGITQINIVVPVGTYATNPVYVEVNSAQAPIYVGK